MSFGKKMFHGLAWSAFDRVSMQIVQFFIGIILARILTPKEYGVIGILLVFIALANVFIDSGFTKALIQKKDRNETDISTIFFFNIGISIVCYLVLWFASPLISEFYQETTLTPLLRALALTLLINSVYAVPTTLFTIQLDFKTLTKINFIATIISGIVAIYMAYKGFGVWALIIQALTKSILMAILVWFFSRWRPQLIFSKKSFKQLFKFGSNLLISSLLNTFVNNISSLFIAKLISTKELGYYTRGTQFSDFTFGMVNSIIERVLLPGLSIVQDQREILIDHTRKILKSTALLIIPIFLFLTVMAKPIIVILLTDKWLPAAPIMQFFCLARMITILSGINVNLLYVLGRTDLALKQQYLKIAIRIVLLLVGLQFGIFFVALGELISTCIHYFINTYFPGKIMKYGAFSQIKDLNKIIIAGVIMAVASFTVTQVFESLILQLSLASLIALLSYYASIKILKIREFNMIKNQLLNFFKS
ncbi:lipopolysaccharide biosynthesis protein [Maribacter sp. 1_2014MBL_MicDiv]|uniref:lipopolysaccharide biosynthesis protein n=1 Tax=Maribacter sp. 1_2014MBL_MicDiv TaxID=1644130 RepID=UPI0008F48BA6|nr:lipopolysaccharide biosynthesis protein [Maribacter sp. 1_2014MBL_MicDiv]APA65501.1 hypothetical protein YQ22_14965 [Maribacter sp. 1_2014MBL_MicDiv]